MGSVANRVAVACLSALLAGCVIYAPAHVPDPQPLERGRLPVADVAVQIPRLGPCTDSPDRTLRFSSNHPVAVLVHGCNASMGSFRSLAQLYAFHGQQAVCFNYHDRDSLVVSSGQLIEAIGELAGHVRDRSVTVIGHSMGGLVARKAMEGERRGEWRRGEANLQLVTVSAPLAGIKAASTCGSRPLHWLTLGTLPGLRWIAAPPRSAYSPRLIPASASPARFLQRQQRWHRAVSRR